MDLSKARKLAWEGPVSFWVVYGEDDLCLVAEMVVAAYSEPDDPVSLEEGVTLAYKCVPVVEFESDGLTLNAASSDDSVDVKLFPDSQVLVGHPDNEIAPNLNGEVRANT